MVQSKNNLHILIISNSYPSIFNSIAGVFWHEQAKYFSEIGNSVGVISIIPISLKAILKKKILFKKEIKISEKLKEFVFCYPNIPKLNFLESYVSLWRGKTVVNEYIKKYGKPDIIHLHRYEGGLLALYIKKRYHIPVILTEHSSRFLYNQLSWQEQNIAKKIFSSVNYRIAVSTSLSEQLFKDYHFDFNYIPNIVDSERFKITHKESSNNDNSFIFFNAGNFSLNKNQEMLIDAFYEFQKTNSLSKLIMAGDGQERKKITNKIKELNLESKVQLIGQISREEMVFWFNKSDTFILSSIKETFGVVIIEAMSCGLPVISTKSGGPEEIIKNKNLGVLCDISTESLSDAMMKIYTNRVSFDKNFIRQYVISNFSKEIILERLIKIYIQKINDQHSY